MNDMDKTTIDAASIATNSSNVFGASTDTTAQVSSGYSKFHTSTLNPSESINPFDKNKPIVETKMSDSTATATTTTLPSTMSSVTTSLIGRLDRFQEASQPSTTSNSTYSTSLSKAESSKPVVTPSLMTGSGNDNVKSVDSSITKQSDSERKPAVSTTTTSRSEAAKYAFGSGQYSTGSMSDSEIIFGSTDDLPELQKKKRPIGRSSFATSIDGDSIYAPKRDASIFNRSLSVSSDVNCDFANDPRVNTSYRIYEGIQNAAFQDFDSPVKAAPVSVASTTTSHTTNTYTSFSAQNDAIDDDDDEDEYDLR